MHKKLVKEMRSPKNHNILYYKRIKKQSLSPRATGIGQRRYADAHEPKLSFRPRRGDDFILKAALGRI